MSLIISKCGRLIVYLLCTVILNFCFANGPINGSFEDFTGEPNGPVVVDGWNSTGVGPEVYHVRTATRNLQPYFQNSPSSDAVDVNIEPNDGQYFLRLTSDLPGSQPGTQLMQVVEVSAGQCISGVYYFDAEDYMPYDDKATIMLMPIPGEALSGPEEIILAEKSISDPHITNFGGMLDWEKFIHVFDSEDAGRYTLVLKVINYQDNALPSFLLVDAITIGPAPPPPACIYKLTGDLNNDCKVDFSDFAQMALNWLIDCNEEPENEACVWPG